MFITGPDVIKDGDRRGGRLRGARRGDVAQHEVGRRAVSPPRTRTACLEDCRYLLSFLPQNNLQSTPRVQPSDDPERMDPKLDQVVPDNPNKPYDMARRRQADRRRRGIL